MGILEQILSAVDNAKRVAVRNTKDFVSNPKDFMNMVANRQLEDSKKSTEAIRKGDPEAIQELAGNVMSPGAGALAGIIRKGGNPALNMTHETSIRKLLNLLTGSPEGLSNPSIAIAKDNARPFQGGADNIVSLVMNPASHAFDPRINPQNLLVNRDAYVSRTKGMLDKEFRLGAEDIRNTEGQDLTNLEEFYKSGPATSGQHMLSIQASPRFRSLAEYERSEAGAKLLGNTIDNYSPKSVDELLQEVLQPAEYGRVSKAKDFMEPDMLISRLRNSAKAVRGKSELVTQDMDIAREAIAHDALKRTQSDYGELKVVGNVPVEGKHISAAILPADQDMRYAESTAQVRALLQQKGVRVGTAKELLQETKPELIPTYEELGTALHKQIAKAQKLFEKNIDETSSENLGAMEQIEIAHDVVQYGMPSTFNKYLGRYWSSLTDSSPEDVTKFLFSSPAFESDVASILTAKDVK